MGDGAHAALDADETLPARPNDANDNDDVFTDTSRTLRDEVESEGEEGVAVAAPVTKKR